VIADNSERNVSFSNELWALTAIGNAQHTARAFDVPVTGLKLDSSEVEFVNRRALQSYDMFLTVRVEIQEPAVIGARGN
jgi:hypothetical protein